MRSLLFLRELIKSEKTNRHLKNFKLNESMPFDELKKLQFQKLLQLLNYLVQYNPFYTQFLKDNAIVLKKDWNDDPYKILSKLPIVDKSFIKKQNSGWLSLNKNIKLTKATTSGSTGVPFEIYHSRISSDVKSALKFRLFKWNDVNRWEKQFYFGCTFGPPISHLNKLKIAVNNNLVFNKHVIDFTEISDSLLKKIVIRINKEKPVSIWGYPSVVYELAKFSLRNNLPIINENLKMVVLSGESSTTKMRESISKAFGIAPCDEYNANEGFIAGSCECGKLHLMEDTLIAEVLKEDGSIAQTGQGELLVTFLYSFDFPFIRYKIGDIVTISDDICKCGRPFKVINSVDGRKGAVIYNGDEKIANATCNHYVTKSGYIDVIDKYQIIQNDIQTVNIKLVVTDENRDYSGFEKIMQSLFDKLSVRFEYVDNIQPQKSGKLLDVINNIR